MCCSRVRLYFGTALTTAWDWTETPQGKVTIFGGGGIYTTTSASVNSDITMYDENLLGYFQLIKRRSTSTGSYGLPVGSSEIFCNTAFGINSSNYLAFATVAAERMRIVNTGNVLINTTTDAGFKLDVNGTARVKTNLKIETSTDGLTIEGDAGGYPTLKINTLRSGTTRRNWMFATEQFAAGDFVLYRSSTGGGAANTQVYSIFNDGNFGLNTSTNAGFKLDVNGTARVATSILVGSGSGTGTVQTGVCRATYFNEYNNNYTIFEVKSNGNASFYQGIAVGTTSNAVASAQVEIVSTTKRLPSAKNDHNTKECHCFTCNGSASL